MEELTEELQKLLTSALKEVIEEWLMAEFVTRNNRKLKKVKDIHLSQFEFDKEGSDVPYKLKIAKISIAVHADVHMKEGNWAVKNFGFNMSKEPLLVYNTESKTYEVTNASELRFTESSSF